MSPGVSAAGHFGVVVKTDVNVIEPETPPALHSGAQQDPGASRIIQYPTIQHSLQCAKTIQPCKQSLILCFFRDGALLTHDACRAAGSRALHLARRMRHARCRGVRWLLKKCGILGRMHLGFHVVSLRGMRRVPVRPGVRSAERFHPLGHPSPSP
jgi:hypothetical protein